jgi:hypothetical protein
MSFTLLTLALPAPVAFAQTTPEREGYTWMVDAGFGLQHDRFYSDTAIGLSGINVGVGRFVRPNLAVTLRAAGTTVRYQALLGSYQQFSGTAGVGLQRWVSDRLNVEAGAGLGYWWDLVNVSGPAFGAIVGVGYSIVSRERSHLQIGVQYAPAFTRPGAVHNIAVTLGYQRF